MTFPATLPGAALAGKAATGLALALLAVGGAGAVTIAATATAGHANVSAPATVSHDTSQTPTGDNGTATAFGQQVKAEVATCKGDLQSGQHGIGSCVSAWVVANNPSNNHQAPPTGAPVNHPSGAPTTNRGR